MSRIANIFNTELKVNKVLAIVASEPHALPLVKALTQTGKRGRPKSTINGKKVYAVLAKAKAPYAFKEFKAMVGA
jgi:hypothetical protein